MFIPQQSFITLLDQILAAKNQHPPQSPLDTGEDNPLTPFSKGELGNADISALERQIDPVRCLLSNGVDQLVYKLYDLTPEGIVIVEGRSSNGNKTRQAADKQLKAIEALPGAVLRKVFDFEEDRGAEYVLF